MDVQQVPISMMRHMTNGDDASDSIVALNANQTSNPALLNESLRSKSDQGSSLPTLDDSPPRPDEKRSASRTKADAPILSLDETTELFRSKVEDARRDTRELAGSEEVSEVVIPRLTLDLGYSNITRLPEAVVDLIKEEVERLSLSHNQIWHIPLRFSECSHLRYLNIRSNVFREIPRGVMRLQLLEILDISRNKVRKIPKDIRILTSLRVLSIANNRIDDLPTELCEMTKLQVLKVSENPLKPKLKQVIEAKELQIEYSDLVVIEREQAVTAEIKRYLRELHPVPPSSEPEPVQAQDEGHMDTPKPVKRVLSSRFPVVPSSSSTDLAADAMRTSPNQTRAPPIPTRSHHRVASGQMGGQKRTGILPFTSSSERNRSNSETGPAFPSGNTRQKRMGMLRKEKSDLDAIDETRASRQSHLRGFSHGSMLRRNGSISSPLIGSSSPGSPRLHSGPVMQTIKRLSSLPEGNAEHNLKKPVIDGAKGILYALHQVEVQIRGLLMIIEDDDFKRTRLEPTFYNASKWLKRLNRTLERAILMDPEDTEATERAEAALQQYCNDSVTAYKHVISQVQENVKGIVAMTDPMVIRTFMLLIFGSAVEIKNAMRSFGLEIRGHRRHLSSGTTHAIQTIPEEFTTPQQLHQPGPPNHGRNVMKPQPGRYRSDTTIHHSNGDGALALQPVQPPQLPPMPHSARLPPNINLTSSTVRDAPPTSASSYTAGGSALLSYNLHSRSNSRTAFSSATNSSLSSMVETPRSEDDFQLTYQSNAAQRTNTANGMLSRDEEQALLDAIYDEMSKCCRTTMICLPPVLGRFRRGYDGGQGNRQRQKEMAALWASITSRILICLESCATLSARLNRIASVGVTSIYAYEGGSSDPSFWSICGVFLASFVDFVTELREAKIRRMIAPEILVAVRPIQKLCQRASRTLEACPWNESAGNSSSATASNTYGSSTDAASQAGGYWNARRMSTYSSPSPRQSFQSTLYPNPSAPASTLNLSTGHSLQSPLSVLNGIGAVTGGSQTAQIPATPLSAALGPAAQATIPSAPASVYGEPSASKLDVFQRADSLLSMPQAGSVNFLSRR